MDAVVRKAFGLQIGRRLVNELLIAQPVSERVLLTRRQEQDEVQVILYVLRQFLQKGFYAFESLNLVQISKRGIDDQKPQRDAVVSVAIRFGKMLAKCPFDSL